MNGAQHEKSATLINAVDNELYDSITRLDQKLKGFLAEIAVKSELITNDELGLKEERQEQLALLRDEIQKAIDGIKHLVTMEIVEGMSHSEFLEVNHNELEKLHEAFKDNIAKVLKLREEF